MAERTYIIGQSGSGKSTLLKSLILSDRGGFLFIDPHGDAALDIVNAGHCDIFWEPARTTIGFNPIKNVPASQRHLVASNITASFKNIFGDSWGPRLEWILYNSVLLLLDNNASLTDIPRLLTDDSYRQKLLRKSSYPQFWDYEFAQWESRQRNEAIAPVLNKVGPFIVNPLLRDTLATTTLNIRRIMDRGQRLVVNLSKGELGEQASSLLGALLVSSVASAAQGRASIPFGDRVPFTLYADEFQNFATDAFATVLSEARKYRLSLCIAHQMLGQVSDSLRQAVFGNVNRFVSFKVGAEDAPAIAAELGLHEPTTMSHGFHSEACELGLHTTMALTGLEPFYAWVRKGNDYFKLLTGPPAHPEGRLEAVRSRTRARYTSRLS